MEESEETAEIVENIEVVEETAVDDDVALFKEDNDSGVDTLDSAGSGSGVESAVILLQALSGNVPNKPCCSGVR